MGVISGGGDQSVLRRKDMRIWKCPKCEKVWCWRQTDATKFFAEDNPEYCPACLPSPPRFGRAETQ